jgi:hypothetical protein
VGARLGEIQVEVGLSTWSSMGSCRIEGMCPGVIARRSRQRLIGIANAEKEREREREKERIRNFFAPEKALDESTFL